MQQRSLSSDCYIHPAEIVDVVAQKPPEFLRYTICLASLLAREV